MTDVVDCKVNFIQKSRDRQIGGYYALKPETFLRDPELARKVLKEIKTKIGYEKIIAYLKVDFSKKGGLELIEKYILIKKEIRNYLMQ